MTIKSIASVGLGIVAAVLAVIALSATGGSAHRRATSMTASGSAIGLRSTSLGPTLVDANGRTLYLFEGDRPNVSTLSAAGQAIWPPFRPAGTVKATNGTQSAALGTVASPGGGRQVTYHGHPLYYYVGDSKPGNTRGQRLNQFGALWYVLGPGGSAVTTASHAPAMPTAPATSYGY